MKRSDRLRSIMQMAQKKEKDAASALGYLHAKVANEQAKRSQLMDYELEYHEKIIETGKTGITGASLRTYFSFMNKLNEAATQQVGHIQELEQQADQVQAYWLKTRGKLKAFESLVDRACQEEQVQADRQEQKILDEFAAQNYLRQRR